MLGLLGWRGQTMAVQECVSEVGPCISRVRGPDSKHSSCDSLKDFMEAGPGMSRSS